MGATQHRHNDKYRLHLGMMPSFLSNDIAFNTIKYHTLNNKQPKLYFSQCRYLIFCEAIADVSGERIFPGLFIFDLHNRSFLTIFIDHTIQNLLVRSMPLVGCVLGLVVVSCRCAQSNNHYSNPKSHNSQVLGLKHGYVPGLIWEGLRHKTTTIS